MAIEPQHIRMAEPKRPPSRATRSVPRPRGLGLFFSGAVLASTGIALGLLRYVFASTDALSAYPHPAWKYVVMVHVLSAPVFFFYLGSIWWQHVVRNWRERGRRLSGALVVAVILATAITGYALYFVGSEAAVAASRVAHTAAGVAGLLLVCYHAVAGWRSNIRR